MKYFKHQTDMSMDVRVKRLIRRYGIEGYGLYTYILELIVRKLETQSPVPELEETAQDIAGDMGMDTLRVEEILKYTVEQGLFDYDNVTGKVVANKVYKYLEQSATRSEQIRKMITAWKESAKTKEIDVSQTVTDNSEEQNRTEQNKKEQDELFYEDFEEAWKHYPRKVGKKAAYKAYRARRKEVDKDTLLTATINYAKAVEHTDQKYIKQGPTFYGPDEWYSDYVGTIEPERPASPSYVKVCKTCHTELPSDAERCDCGGAVMYKRVEAV